MSDGMYDEMLLSLAQRHDSLGGLLHTLFSFFERRTDLFHVFQEDGPKMGFPQGHAQDMVLEAYRLFQQRYDERTGQGSGIPPPSIGKGTSNAPKPHTKAAGNAPAPGAWSSAPGTGETGACPTLLPSSPPPTTTTTTTTTTGTTPGTTTTSMNPHLAPSAASSWNGAVVEGKYTWSQSISEVTVEIPLPRTRDVWKSNMVDVKLMPQKVHIKMKETTTTTTTPPSTDQSIILMGEFDDKIKVENSMWTLGDNTLVLSLEKHRATWWKCFLLGDPEIDTTKVESKKHVHEYDDETQGQIRKIMFDQNQKSKGEPTSDQIRTAEIMKAAWDQEGSPFKGQPYDPSLLNLQGQLPPEF